MGHLNICSISKYLSYIFIQIRDIVGLLFFVGKVSIKMSRAIFVKSLSYSRNICWVLKFFHHHKWGINDCCVGWNFLVSFFVSLYDVVLNKVLHIIYQQPHIYKKFPIISQQQIGHILEVAWNQYKNGNCWRWSCTIRNEIVDGVACERVFWEFFGESNLQFDYLCVWILRL